ncbi:MAG: PHP domain-containing protein [Candidatus Odinarchaeota archaeon]|nr:PHP domain-containing protein [Candidatus Odinarchaeota archaeon]
MVIADFHIHTIYSNDSSIRIKDLLKYSNKKGIDVIAITDHNEIKGAKIAKYLSRKMDSPFVIVGEELKTYIGDLLFLFIDEKIDTKDPLESLDLCHEMGGICIFPHPPRYHNLNDELTREVLSKVDAIEIYNSHTLMRKDSIEFLKSFRKPFVAGSDAHVISEVGLCRNILRSSEEDDIKREIRSGMIRVEGKISIYYYFPLLGALYFPRLDYLKKAPRYLRKIFFKVFKLKSYLNDE